MPYYEVVVHCTQCGERHPVKNAHIEDGPSRQVSVADFYADGELPTELHTINTNYLFCPKTSNWFLQKDNHQVFLVPVESVDALDPSLGTVDASGGRKAEPAPYGAQGAGDTGVRETGDILGASSTHTSGPGREMENTGGTGTAPTGGSLTERGES